MKYSILIFILGIGLTIGCVADERACDGTAQGSIYENVGRTFRESFVGDAWRAGKIKPRLPLEAQAQNPLWGEATFVALYNCSNSDYKCVYGSFRVFAVPRARLSPKLTYELAGSIFRVESCLRGDAKVCQVALISSDCNEQFGTDGCRSVSGGRKLSKNSGPVLYFIYNEDLGVTAYGSQDQRATGVSEALLAARDMILQGTRGLLSN
jgi:hypothetical protein